MSSRQHPKVVLKRVRPNEKRDFMQMACRYYRELNPRFKPVPDWRKGFFRNIRSDKSMHLDWLLAEGQRAGFVLWGVERHRFRSRIKIGKIHEFFVLSPFRGRGIATGCFFKLLGFFKRRRIVRIEIEICPGNRKAARFWKGLKFRKSAERFQRAIES